MAKDVCIKAGSFCPVCRGIIGADCWHEARQFHAGSEYLDKLLKAQDRIKELEDSQSINFDAETLARYYKKYGKVGLQVLEREISAGHAELPCFIATVIPDEAMVKRALDAVWKGPHGVETQRLMRKAIAAALTKEQP